MVTNDQLAKETLTQLFVSIFIIAVMLIMAVYSLLMAVETAHFIMIIVSVIWVAGTIAALCYILALMVAVLIKETD